MRGILEGFEGEYALIEIEGESKDVPRTLLHPECRAGDVVSWNGELWEPAKQATRARNREIQKLMEDVWID